MDIQKVFLATVCYATDTVIPKLESASSRWLAYGAIAAYRPKLNNLLQQYSGILTDLAVVNDSGVDLERVKEIAEFAFSKEPVLEFEIPVLELKLKISKADYEQWLKYVELSAQKSEN